MKRQDPFLLRVSVTLILGVLLSFQSLAQTEGEVMFVGFNAEGTDGFAFVTFVELADGLNIYFSENEWNGNAIGAGGAFNDTNEGGITWTNNTGSALPAGTVVTITNAQSTADATVGTASESTAGFNLGTSNTVLYMFLGTDDSTPTVFLSAIANDQFGNPQGTIANTGLTAGVNATNIDGDEDVMVYTGSTTCNGTIADCAAEIANTGNWTTYDGGGDQYVGVYPDDVYSSDDFIGSLFVMYSTLPFTEDFESGSLGSSWSAMSDNNGQILVSGANTPNGSFHLAMDANPTGTFSQNEAWLHLDLSGQTQVDLSFEWKDFGDENHTQDGIFFSDDGGSGFTQVLTFVPESETDEVYQTINMDVDALASGAGLTLNSTFVIKFQQYDNWSLTNDGFTFDDISVTSPVAPSGATTWYSYQTGNFNDGTTWTLDPSGTTYDNGMSDVPGTGDAIVILNGFTVTADISSSVVATTIEAGGILDMSTETGWDLGTVTGQGLLRMNGVNLLLVLTQTLYLLLVVL